MVPHVERRNHEDDVLGDVRGVVTEALQVAGNQDQVQRATHRGRIRDHVALEFVENLALEPIDRIVQLEHLLSEGLVVPDEGIQAESHHLAHLRGHARNIDQGLERRLLQVMLAVVRDIDRLVAHALEIGIDLDRRHDPAQVGGQRGLAGQDLHAGLVDQDVVAIDLLLDIIDRLEPRRLPQDQRLGGLLDRLLDQASHRQNQLLQFSNLGINLSFHDLDPRWCDLREHSPLRGGRLSRTFP